MSSKFKVGDRVKQVTSIDGFLFKGEATIIKIGSIGWNGYELLLMFDEVQRGMHKGFNYPPIGFPRENRYWFVRENNIELVDETTNPYWKVCCKIKQMDKARKEMGYAF